MRVRGVILALVGALAAACGGDGRTAETLSRETALTPLTENSRRAPRDGGGRL
jgi:hypothetical protein